MYALLFPTSYVKAILRDALDPFGIEFALLMPTEKSPVIAETRGVDAPPGQERINDKGICPAPLGAKLEAFEGIVKSYLAWAEHIDLGHSIHAQEMERLQVEDPESVQALIKSIRAEGQGPDELLDAQIFLELSLISDIQHDSLDQDLAYIKKREALLYTLMDGSTGDGALSAPADLASLRLPPMSQPRRRLAMWAKLFSMLKDWGFFRVLLGEGQEIRDILDSRYEERSGGRAAIEVARLSLDPHVNLPKGARDHIKGQFKSLVEALSSSKEVPEESLALAQELMEKWHQLQPRQTPLTLNIVHYSGVKNALDLILDNGPSKGANAAMPLTRMALFVQ